MTLIEHLRGPDHRLTDAQMEPFPDGRDFNAEWLRAVHITHHRAPYPPVVAHDYEDLR